MHGNNTANLHQVRVLKTCGTRTLVALLHDSNMSSAAREKDQADFDLERFIDMFDEAVSSKDPRVVNALRSLMMMVTLTRPESRDSGLHDRNAGPLRRLFEDMNHLNNRLHRVEAEVRHLGDRDREAIEGYKKAYQADYPFEKYSLEAAKQMAQQVDRDLLNTFKIKAQGLFDK